MENNSEKKYYYFYKHQNKINNKVYIGQTYQNPPEKRWKNGKGYKPCVLFNSAIEKYGWENFSHEILLEGWYSIQEANEIEYQLILKYDSKNPKKGYNINDGGGRSISQNAIKGALKWMEEHPSFGQARAKDMLKWQQEHPEEAYAFRLQNVAKATEARKKPVRCIETGEVFESAAAASRATPKTSQSKICMVCRGQRNICGGYHWEYVNK